MNKITAVAIITSLAAFLIYERGWWKLFDLEDKQTAPGFYAPELKSLPFFVDADFTPKWLSRADKIPADILHMRPLALTDQFNQSFNTDKVQNKFIVANFFFASCGGFCPRLMRNIKVAYDGLRSSEDVLFVSFSVTPDEDTPAVLRKYADDLEIKKRWHLLTGSKEEILSIARNDFYADTNVDSKQSSGDFLHSENVYLLDSERRIRAIYNGNNPTSLAKLANDIATLRNENVRYAASAEKRN